MENGGDKGNGNADDAEERNVERSFASFSLEKETMEPWPPPLLSLGDVMMGPNPNQLYRQTNINTTAIGMWSVSLFTTLTSAAQH